jgi:hypothetical protein
MPTEDRWMLQESLVYDSGQEAGTTGQHRVITYNCPDPIAARTRENPNHRVAVEFGMRRVCAPLAIMVKFFPRPEAQVHPTM